MPKRKSEIEPVIRRSSRFTVVQLTEQLNNNLAASSKPSGVVVNKAREHAWYECQIEGETWIFNGNDSEDYPVTDSIWKNDTYGPSRSQRNGKVSFLMKRPISIQATSKSAKGNCYVVSCCFSMLISAALSGSTKFFADFDSTLEFLMNCNENELVNKCYEQIPLDYS